MHDNPFTESYPNTCISCGFLSIINLDKQREPVELDAARRALGRVSARQDLWCFRRKARLEVEVGEVEERMRQEPKSEAEMELDPSNQAQREREAAITEVIRRDRHRPCVEDGAWYEWVEYFGPQWHYENWRMMDIEEFRRRQTQMIADVEQRGQDSLRETMEAQKEITAKLAAIAVTSDKSNTRFNRLFLFVGVLAICLALLPLGFPKGIPWVADKLNGNESLLVVVIATPHPTDIATVTAVPSPSPSPITLTPTPTAIPPTQGSQ